MDDLQKIKSLEAQICRRCTQFYANKNTNRMCSQCYKATHTISAFSELHTCMKTISPKKSSNKIRSGLLLYAFKGCADWRLRSKHSTSLIIYHTKYTSEVSRYSYQKTLKYVRTFKDMRKGKYDRELLSYQVLRQLKAMICLNVMIIDGVSCSILKRLCQILSKLNPKSLTLNFIPPNGKREMHKKDYFNPLFWLLQRMRNLHYLDTGNLGNLEFRSKFKTRLPRYARMMGALSHLTDIKLGKFYDYLSLPFKVFLNHGQCKRIQPPITSLFSKENVEAFFENFGCIKDLDYLEIRTDTRCAPDNCETFLEASLWQFLSSTNSIETLVLNHPHIIENTNYDSDTILPTQITSVRNLVIKGYICNSSIKMMQAVKGLDSLQFHMDKRKSYDKVIETMNKILLENLSLKNLAIKFWGSGSAILIPLVNNVVLPNLKTLTLDFSESFDASDCLIRDSELGLSMIQFLRNQPEMQDIVLKLGFPIDLKRMETLLDKLAEFPKLNLIILYLERLNDLLFYDGNYISKLNAFCDALRKSPYFECDFSPKRYVILRSMKLHY